MRRRTIAAIGAALALTLAWGQAAVATDAPVADGDLVDGVFEADGDGPNDATQFGDVCPGGTYERDVRLAVRRQNAQPGNSFLNGAQVTWGFFPNPNDPSDTDGGQEVDPAYGRLSTVYTGRTAIQMPANWQTRAEGVVSPIGSSTDPFIEAEATLTVPETAPAGDPNGATSNGTLRFRANGSRSAGSADTAGSNRAIANHWTVLDGDATGCDRAPVVTASFQAPSLACGTTPELRVRVRDPDAGVTSEDGLELRVEWGAGIPDVTLTGIKEADRTLTIPAPYATAGTRTATVSWSDGHLDGSTTTGSTTATVAIAYDTSGILQPVNADGTSIFKAGSTVPVKVRFVDCDGTVPNDLGPTITATKTGGSSPTTGVVEVPTNTSAHADGVLRFSDGQWIYNLSTRSLSDPTATYRLTITVPATGQTVSVGFGLRA